MDNSTIINAQRLFLEKQLDLDIKKYINEFEQNLAEGLLADGDVFDFIVTRSTKLWISESLNKFWVPLLSGQLYCGKDNDADWVKEYRAYSRIGHHFNNGEDVCFLSLSYYNNAPIILHPKPLDHENLVREYGDKVGDAKYDCFAGNFAFLVGILCGLIKGCGFVCTKYKEEEYSGELVLELNFCRDHEVLILKYNHSATYPELDIFLKLYEASQENKE